MQLAGLASLGETAASVRHATVLTDRGCSSEYTLLLFLCFNACQARHILTDRGCSSCDDGCTGLLLDKTELLAAELADKAGHLESGGLAPPWEQLFALEHRTMDHQLLLEQYKNASRAVQNLPAKIDEDISKKVKQLLNK
ncbi:laminin subunit alpha-1-like, partial [Homalodisca vitripennis]|uniref:laminin subunit alpha-1-like n=1 Tax=Homalodisca vitripennis TaxID=197043 RepID=UPI001EECDBA5